MTYVHGHTSTWSHAVHGYRRQVFVVVALLGCSRASPDHQTLGDQAYLDGLFGDALVEYRLALSANHESPDLRAKAALAALNGVDLEAAAQEYVALALAGEPSRREEAADGLVRVANLAIEEGNQTALAVALDGLQEVAPGRALGSFAGHLASSIEGQPQTEDALALLTFAAAGATNAGTQDSLMFVYGVTLRRLGRCTEAAPIFESLVRRRRAPRVAEGAQRQLALCALNEGRRALRNGQVVDAEAWFRRAVAGAGDTPETRAAYVGLGDVRMTEGDYFGAVDAFLRAMDGLLPGDSMYDIADQRLKAIGDASRTIP
ncbi:MAG: tetratricopeptide repeat protein [Gemmatimonadales bacterium]